MSKVSRFIKKNTGIIILLLITLLFLFPFYWMVVGSITSQATLYDAESFKLFPTEFQWSNYERLFAENPVLQWFGNSLLFASVTTVVVVFTNTMAGYALAKKKFFGSAVLFMCFVGTIMLPRQVLMVPMYLTMRDLKLLNYWPSIVLPAMAWPMGIFLMRQFMHTIPNEVLESASLDGASEWRVFLQIVMPLSKPGIGALTIMTFMSAWNDYLWQVIIISNRVHKTLPLGVAGLQSEFAPDYGILFAGATIAAIPMVTVFLMFQKYFTRGISLGAVKG